MERELKKEEVGNMEKKGADFREWSQPFLFIPKRLQVLNANSEIMSKISGYKDRGTESERLSEKQKTNTFWRKYRPLCRRIAALPG